MKNTFEIFKKSLSSVSLYREAREAPFGNGLRYYVWAIFLLSLIATVGFGVFSIPQGIRFMKEEALPLVQERYPADLQIVIRNGEASTNTTTSTIMYGEKKILSVLFNDDSIENILVVDTEREYARDVFDNYRTFALLSKHDFVMRKAEGGVMVQSLSNFPKMTVSSTTLVGFIEQVNSLPTFFVVIPLMLVFALLFTGYVMYLVPLALFALIPFFLAWKKNIPLSYRGAYKMSVYAAVPGLAFKTLFNIGGVLSVPAYSPLLIFMLIIFLVMKKMEQ